MKKPAVACPDVCHPDGMCDHVGIVESVND